MIRSRTLLVTTLFWVGALCLTSLAYAAQSTPQPTDQNAPVEEPSPEEMEAQLRQLLQADPDNAEALLRLGGLMFQLGRIEEAKQLLQRCTEVAPEIPEAHATLAVILEQQGDLEGAEREFTQALQLIPENTTIRIRRASLRHRLNRSDEALADLNHAAAIDPQNLQALFGQSAILVALGRQQEAMEPLRTVLETTTEPKALAEAHLMLGNLQAGQGEYDGAADDFTQSVSADPDNPQPQFGLAVALMMAERYPEALASLDKSATKFPDNVAMKHVLARLLATCPDESVRDGQRSRQLATEVMESSPGAEHAQTLAMALAELGDFEQAANLQRQVITRIRETGSQEDTTIMQQRLEKFEQQQPVRAPWLAGT